MDKLKRKKAVEIALNVLTGIVVIIVIAIAVSAIVNSNVGYNAIFGIAGVSVQSDSMKGDKKDNFEKGDLIYIEILKAKELSQKVKEGDIITYWGDVAGKRSLISHRVIGIGNSGDMVYYTTHGDNEYEGVNSFIAASEVVGKFNGSVLKGMGKVTDFFNGQVGFGIFVIAPSILLVIYAGYAVFKAYKNYHKEVVTEQTAAAVSGLSDEELEKLYQARLLAKADEIKEAEAEKSADDVPV